MLGDSKSPCSVSELANKMNVDKSSVYRILATMRKRGFVSQAQDSKKYCLGLQIVSLGAKVLSKMTLVTILKPFLQKLADLTNETSHLAVLRESKIVFIDRIEGSEVVAVRSSVVGDIEPAYSSATGKAILAFLSTDELTNAIMEMQSEKFVRFTDKTISSISQLEDEIAKVRQNGYAFDNEEHYPGVKCLAAPILNHDQCVIASIGISAPASRMTSERIPSLVDKILSVAAQTSRHLMDVRWN
jgi:DNA-binding IclR family transcriptional regulator